MCIPLAQLWDIVADTDRLNWPSGMGKIHLTPLNDMSAARYVVKTKLNGFDVTFEEQPFAWVYLDSFKVSRCMRAGPLLWLEMGLEFTASGDAKTRLILRLKAVPRSFLWWPMVVTGSLLNLRSMAQEVQRIDRALQSGVFPPPPRHPPVVREALMTASLAQLRESKDADGVRRLEALLRAGSDLKVARLRPYALAAVWKRPRRETLSLCLHAVVAGLLGELPKLPRSRRCFGTAATQLASADLSNLNPIDVAPAASITLTHSGSWAKHAKLERYDWATQAATARDVIQLPAYTSHFSLPMTNVKQALDSRRGPV